MEQHRCMGCMAMTENEICEKCGWPDGRTNEPHQLPVGYLLRGQYQIGRVLGQGGFGITYLGWDDFLEIPVAIKEFFPNSMVNRECSMTTNVHCYTEQVTPQYVMSKERFLREAKALARFEDEPAIVRIRNFFQENETAYIVMEYVRGTNLAAYVNIRGGKLTPEETFRILYPIMDALDSVHKADLVHRDISPDNIMLHPRGGAKLLDFGAVRTVEDAQAGKDMQRSTEAILKHGFAPMEQYQSRGGLGPWTDEYALCATIYYCLTGRIPEEAPRRMLEEIEPDWNIPGLLPHQQAALAKGMALRAKDRFGTIRELMDALFTVPAPVPAEPPVVQPPKPEKPPKAPKPPKQKPEKAPKQKVEKPPKTSRGRKLLWLIPAVAAVLAAVAVAVFLFLPNGWKKDENGDYRYYTQGQMAVDQWVREGDLWYHVNAQGTMDTGWTTVDGLRYYFGTDGVRVTGWREINRNKFYFGTDGVRVTGLREIDGKYYLFDDRGVMHTGWKLYEGDRIYFREDGSRAKGWETIGEEVFYFTEDGITLFDWQTIDGERYYFNYMGVMQTGMKSVGTAYYYFGEDGAVQTGWFKVGSNTYFAKEDGKLATGWLKLGGKTYHFSENGVMHTDWKTIGSDRYNFGATGVMQTGWRFIGTDKYYFGDDGKMHVGWLTLNGKRYYFGTDGKMYTGTQAIDGRWYTFASDGVLR